MTYNTDGLVWPRGDSGWKTVPVGACILPSGVNSAFLHQPACVRYEASVNEPAVTFADLLTRYPENLSEPPRILRAVVFPSNLDTIICVWNQPVVPRDVVIPELNNAGISFDGRLMYVQAQPVVGQVTLDKTNLGTITINAGRFIRYRAINEQEPNEGDSFVEPIENQQQSIQVQLARTYNVVDVNQSNGTPHQVWGASYCLRGMVSPFPLIPFGQYIAFSGTSLSPPGNFYVGIASTDGADGTGYFGRARSFKVIVIGAASSGRMILNANNDTGRMIVPGEAVRFTLYNTTACSVPNVVKLSANDTPYALQTVDDAIVKPVPRICYVNSTSVTLTLYVPTAWGTNLVVCSGSLTSTISVLTAFSNSSTVTSLNYVRFLPFGTLSRTLPLYHTHSPGTCYSTLQLYSNYITFSGEGTHPYYYDTTIYTLLSPILVSNSVPSGGGICACYNSAEPTLINIQPNIMDGFAGVCTIRLRRLQNKDCIYGSQSID